MSLDQDLVKITLPDKEIIIIKRMAAVQQFLRIKKRLFISRMMVSI